MSLRLGQQLEEGRGHLVEHSHGTLLRGARERAGVRGSRSQPERGLGDDLLHHLVGAAADADEA
jgi:hypothetical protein